jgi:hypothetical protein
MKWVQLNSLRRCATAACGFDRKEGAKMVSQMVVSGSKNAGPPWFLKCILYLGRIGKRYYTSSTIEDGWSCVKRQEGLSLLSK